MELKSYFDIFFKEKFKSAIMTDFETWFSTMASYVYKTDFEQIKPSGRKGDKKCDGHRISTETIYQCYAPESVQTFNRDAKNKIADSFPQVVEDWSKMREWIFIHNNEKGLPVTASNKLEDLRKTYPDIKFGVGSREFLKSELHDKLSVPQLYDVYPDAAKNVQKIPMDNIQPLLKRIIAEKKDEFDEDVPFGEFPNKEKIEFNNLSAASKRVIKLGRMHIDVVRRYLDNLSIPDNVTVIQNTIRGLYKRLIDFEYQPDDILAKMIEYLQIEKTLDEQMACWVLIAYFFDTCDIFKNAPVKSC